MYEAGVGIAFLMWAGYVAHMLASLNSKMQRNLNRIGQKLSWTTLRPKAMEQNDQHPVAWGWTAIKFIGCVAVSLPLVLGSWLYVLWVGARLTYAHFKDAGAPQNVKEYRWKLRNCDLTFNQIIKETLKMADLPNVTFEQAKYEMIEQMKGRGLHVNYTTGVVLPK